MDAREFERQVDGVIRSVRNQLEREALVIVA